MKTFHVFPDQTPRSDSVQGPETSLLMTARSLVAAGISVIPWQTSTKLPAYNRLPVIQDAAEGRSKPSWAPFTERYATDTELVDWFADGRCGIAVVCGAISGGLVVLDIESLSAYEQWRMYAATLLPAHVLESLPVIRTGRGKHVYFRMAQPRGNQVLARRKRSSSIGWTTGLGRCRRNTGAGRRRNHGSDNPSVRRRICRRTWKLDCYTNA